MLTSLTQYHSYAGLSLEQILHLVQAIPTYLKVLNPSRRRPPRMQRLIEQLLCYSAVYLEII